MLPDEEDEVNRLVINQEKQFIKYKKINDNYNRLLRCDIERKNIIIKELKIIMVMNQINFQIYIIKIYLIQI